MPDLSGFDSPLTGRLIMQMVFGKERLNAQITSYRTNFIRLMDKALAEYAVSRNIILAQIAESNRSVTEMAKHGRVLYILQFTDHMEDCINALSRLFRLLERINSQKDSLTLPRAVRRLVQSESASVTLIRNCIEHIEEKIQAGEISPGDPIMLALNKGADGVVISEFEISFRQLAMVLSNMYKIALFLVSPKSDPTTNPS